MPGITKNDPPYQGGRQKGHKRDAQREERQKNIQECLAKMPQLIAEHRVGAVHFVCLKLGSKS